MPTVDNPPSEMTGRSGSRRTSTARAVARAALVAFKQFKKTTEHPSQPSRAVRCEGSPANLRPDCPPPPHLAALLAMFSSATRTALPRTATRAFSASARAKAETLVFLETKGDSLVPSAANAITAAKKVGGKVTGLIIGKDEASVKPAVDRAKKCVHSSSSTRRRSDPPHLRGNRAREGAVIATVTVVDSLCLALAPTLARRRCASDFLSRANGVGSTGNFALGAVGVVQVLWHW